MADAVAAAFRAAVPAAIRDHHPTGGHDLLAAPVTLRLPAR